MFSFLQSKGESSGRSKIFKKMTRIIFFKKRNLITLIDKGSFAFVNTFTFHYNSLYRLIVKIWKNFPMIYNRLY
jgi:hypothetical protein